MDKREERGRSELWSMSYSKVSEDYLLSRLEFLMEDEQGEGVCLKG